MPPDPLRLDARVSVLENVSQGHRKTLEEHAATIEKNAAFVTTVQERFTFYQTFVRGAMWVAVPVTTVVLFLLSQLKTVIGQALLK